MNDDPQDDPNQIINDDTGEQSASGDSPEDVQDIDQEAANFGLPQDTDEGPTQLGVGQAVNDAEEIHQKED